MSHSAKKVGLPPGALVYVGKATHEKSSVVKIIDYGGEKLEEYSVKDMEDFLSTPPPDCESASAVNWVNLDGIHDQRIIEKFGRKYSMDSLVLEDIMDTGTAPQGGDF